MLRTHTRLNFNSKNISILLKPMLTAALLLIVAGCARTQSYEDTYNTASAPSKLPSGPIALVMSDSATETIRELTTYHDHFKKGWAAHLYTQAIRQAYVETSDPDLSLAGVTLILKKRFGEVYNFQTFEDASRSGLPLVVKLDMKIRLINNRSSEPASRLSLGFYTPDQRHLGTVKSSTWRVLTPLWAHNKRELEIVADIRQQEVIQRQSLELLEQRLMHIPMEGVRDNLK